MPRPFIRGWNINVKHSILGLRFVINRVKASNILEKLVKIRMRAWINGDFKERLEETPNNILEVVNTVMNSIDVIKTRHLNQPTVMIRIDIVGDSPTC